MRRFRIKKKKKKTQYPTKKKEDQKWGDINKQNIQSNLKREKRQQSED